MASEGWPDFNEDYVPTASVVNALKVVIWGLATQQVRDYRDNRDFGWLLDHMPNFSRNFFELNSGWGLVSDIRDDEDFTAILGTDILLEQPEYAVVVEKHTGFPVERFANDKSFDAAAWVKANWPDIRFKGTGPRTGINGVSAVVKQTSYTPQEAAVAFAEITKLVAAKKITGRSASAYKAHVTRRIAA